MRFRSCRKAIRRSRKRRDFRYQALRLLAASKAKQEQLCKGLEQSAGTKRPAACQGDAAVQPPDAEDILRESGYMLPQSKNVQDKSCGDMLSTEQDDAFPMSRRPAVAGIADAAIAYKRR
jgi:hypothetical protein